MKSLKTNLLRATAFLGMFILVCGILYTGAVTAVAQMIFPKQANGSIIEVNGVKYGSELMGQPFTEENHMWGRIMNLDVSTYKTLDGEQLLYGVPSNLSPVGDAFLALVEERKAMIEAAHPDKAGQEIPVDLLTCSGSGLDPHISPEAARYQVSRLAAANGMTEEEVQEIIKSCTEGKFLGVLGTETVNVLKVNLMLDGILS